MSDRTRAFFISLSILALLMFSAVGTIPVYADDGTTSGSTETTPTSTDQGATTTTASDPSTVGDAQPPLDSTTTTAETPPEPVTTTETPAEPVETPLLEQVPDNITVTVVDATGDAQPLASQDSATAVELSDPIWCPASQTTPTPGANGCTTSYSSFTELLTFLKTNEGDAAYQVDGTIYVQQGAYAGGEQSIDFNSYNFTQINQKKLTVTGGWDTTTNTVSSTSSFSVPISIGSSSNPWVGSLTLNNLVIDGATDQTGLTLYSQGDIALSNVEVTNSQNGAELNAGGNVTVKNSKFHKNKNKGADVTSGGSVDVSGSQFNDNGSGDVANPTGSGLGIQSSGAVTLLDVAASNNQLFGADIGAGSSVVIQQSLFNGNQSYYWFGDKTYYGYGLQVVTPADIGLINVTADNNNLLGAHLEGSDVIVNTGSFSNNGSGTGMDLFGKGLEVVGTQDVNFGKGDVSLNNITADNNKLFGADIQTTGNVAIGASEGKVSSFSGNIAYVYGYDTPYGTVSNVNGGYGLKVVALTGDIALAHVKTTGNFLYGTSLEGVKIAITDGVFSSNGSGAITYPVGFGLKVVSTGALGVTLKDVIANNNQLYGADVRAVGNVDIGASTDKFSTFTGNQSVSFDPCSGLTFYGYGLTVFSTNGAITLNHVEANFNNLWGGNLDGLNVDIANSKFNNNVSDSHIFIDDTGLLVNSRGGFVLLNNVEAKDNRLIGATIKAVGDVYILSSTFTGNAGITCSISWCPPGSEIYWGYGLNVVTPGFISLDGVNASNNNLFGANLEGSKVKVSNSTFSNNAFGNGLTIKATADVLLTNVTAENNGANGVEVTSTGSCVQVIGGIFTGNTQYGISVSGAQLNLDGTQTFGGNGSGNYQGTLGTCVSNVTPVIIFSAALSASGNNNALNQPVVLTSNTASTTLSADPTNNNTTVSSHKKHTKAKKAHARHPRAKVKVAKILHSRNHR